MINEAFRKLVLDRLEGEEIAPGRSIEEVVDTMVMEHFETKVKRDITLKREHLSRNYKFTVPGLQANAEKGFDDWTMNIEEHEIARLFDKVLHDIVILISEQFERCKQKKVDVDASLNVLSLAERG